MDSCDGIQDGFQFDEEELIELGKKRRRLVREIEDLQNELDSVNVELQTLDASQDSAELRAKQIEVGRKKFNMDAKKGIEFLIDKGILQRTPEEIARFLGGQYSLSKAQIGEYIGDGSDFNKAVMRAFVALQEFSHVTFVEALRQFLQAFRLPGEAQKIDRLMEAFAQRYCDANPGVFANSDTCYVLAFSVIMLNTSLHNPAVKGRDRLDLDKFVVVNRGINGGADFDVKFLTEIYENIHSQPFAMPEEDADCAFLSPDREGWLLKQGGRVHSWKRRWFILKENCLFYFQYTTSTEPTGIIPLEDVVVRECAERSKPFCFEIVSSSNPTAILKACKLDKNGMPVQGRHTRYVMSAASAEERDFWVNDVTKRIAHNPYRDLIQQHALKAKEQSNR